MKNKLMSTWIFIMTLALASVSCGLQAAPAVIAASPAVQAPKSGPTAEAGTATVCRAETLNVRAHPSTSAEVVGHLTNGDSVTITGAVTISADMGEWLPMYSGKIVGWTNARYLCAVKK